MKVGIIGAGIMGICLGYYLSQQGLEVEIFEASPVLGGLAGPLILEDGTSVDRFYHTILSSDSHLLQLCAELGIGDQLRFKETRMGFYDHGKVFSMNNLIEFLRFPLLGWVDRFRLGLTVLYSQFIRDWRSLEGVGVEDWLISLSGRRTYENIWRPMLKAKFDGDFAQMPATYIWSRLVRMKSTRNGANQKEMAGHLIGGYITLIEAMAKQINACGGKINLRQPVKEIVIRQGNAVGVQVGLDVLHFDVVVATLQSPIFTRIIPDAGSEYLEFLNKTEYLGIIAPILVLNRPLTGYWTINITEDHFPFTGIIETTAYIDPKYVGGYHLVYLPKYIAPDSEWQKKSNEEIKGIWINNLKAICPEFDLSSIKYFLIHRERYVEPLHRLNQTDLIPSIITPINHLYLATTAQIYPELTNGESVSRHAKEVARIILNRQ